MTLCRTGPDTATDDFDDVARNAGGEVVVGEVRFGNEVVLLESGMSAGGAREGGKGCEGELGRG